MATLWLADIQEDDVETVGGKAASLGEMHSADLPVPPAFVVTADTYRSFLKQTGLEQKIQDALTADAHDSEALADTAEDIQNLIRQARLPDQLRKSIINAYDQFGEEIPVAVRSSATAEDLPDASFAGQQETFLNVTRETLIDRIKECWASLFTQRAIYYRREQGYEDLSTDIAVAVQKMVNADKSGVLFTRDPSTDAPLVTVEAAWGLGEAVVSGAVTPDNYVIERETGKLQSRTVSEQEVMFVRDSDSGETIKRAVPTEKRAKEVLSESELDDLRKLGVEIESYYEAPQDVEWAIADGTIYLLQARPITTIPTDVASEAPTEEGSPDSSRHEGRVILSGLGASPGQAAGDVTIVRQLDELDRVSENDILVAEQTTPDMVTAMKRAAGIITDEGGVTSHATIVSRELGVPAVVGVRNATDRLRDGQHIKINGDKGTVTSGSATSRESDRDAIEEVRPDTPVKPMTATKVQVNLSIPEAAKRAAATGADGVGLLRLEHLVLSLGKTPRRYIDEHSPDAYSEQIAESIQTVAEEFHPRPVRVRTLDAPTDEFRSLEGGKEEPVEDNPMLGYRGIRRGFDRPTVLQQELTAFRKLFDMGYDNIEIMFPLVTDAEDVHRARQFIEDAGIDSDKRDWGVMIETPAAALSIEGIVDAGVDFVSFGTNDLTQYTLAVDRNNELIAENYDELHPAILSLLSEVIKTCRKEGVATSICGQAGSKPDMIRHLVTEGITTISANIDAVRDVQHEVKRVEQELLLDSVR